MFLYLVQHAEAKPEHEDPQRGLSEKGLRDIKKVAYFISKINIQVDEIMHSGKLRAKETAEILANALKIKTYETEGLAPLDPPEIWADKLKNIDKSIMLVGHLPHLGHLASLLICGDKEKNIVLFKMAGIVCLVKENLKWSLKWMITPDVIPD
ncbi:MAG: phosphohistidine phosphatase SixA [Thermodesulfovibrio sp.]|uniref:phosphohistidine phosphatase SixA n=1 Tax=unclassified Thermodesulfovibrio TaxID=2645936 RepID=UPI00083AFEFE|nr:MULTISPECIES: phosphohistidine phosphatase SixA [unclassified Thermodesulfovibrio]MDI1472799.1 phosphohistidine phosphatase SixA [Thermodesulfovibrio sp. 1176]MDI6713498.1 phosphohistidine phosphatase SixA [Thermodesulfovibrio sp.]ODA44556.1 hypothetical protein THER_0704 [Thermodesulfovibrio sp. N1]